VIGRALAGHCSMMKNRLVLALLGMSLVACGGNVSLGGPPTDGGREGASSGGSGGSSGGTGSGSGSGSSSSGSSSGATQPDASVNPLSGTYTGYIQSFMFPDGSDTVVMTLAFAGSTVTGTVYFGNGSPLPPATDPNVGYPPGFTGSDTVPLEGFEFTALGGTYTAPRVQLSIQSTEMWKQWCEIQTMIYPFDNGTNDGGCGPLIRYSCLPNGETQGGGSGTSCAFNWCQQPTLMSVDCGKLFLCFQVSVCTCTATACTVPITTPGGIAFDMQLASGMLSGSVTGLEDQNVYNVFLTRGP
jgi:hypothetical protein